MTPEPETLQGKQVSIKPLLKLRMPAEWEPHEATWLTWPQNEETWPGKMAKVEETYREIITHLAKHEKVHILVNNARTEQRVSEQLSSLEGRSRVFFHQIPTDDAWIRDNGPTFVEQRDQDQTTQVLIDWEFNSWGGKYPPWDHDNAVPQKVSKILGTPSLKPGIIMEGGSVDVNGLGMCLTTESCLLKSTRNKNLKREEIEGILKQYLGLQKICWLQRGVSGDDTDGHIDNLARFVNPTTLVAALEEDEASSNYTPLRENFHRLRNIKDQEGQVLKVIPIPMPGEVEFDGNLLPASYLNFYIANGVVLVPLYGFSQDRRVLNILEALFPTREVIGIRCQDLVIGLGALHCITQQQPVLPV